MIIRHADANIKCVLENLVAVVAQSRIVYMLRETMSEWATLLNDIILKSAP